MSQEQGKAMRILKVVASAVVALNKFWSVLLNGLSDSSFLRTIELAGKLTIVVAVVTWLFGSEDRKVERYNAALRTLFMTSGQAGDLGRSRTLTALLNDGNSLAGMPLKNAELKTGPMLR
jgi:hypothetical protein